MRKKNDATVVEAPVEQEPSSSGRKQGKGQSSDEKKADGRSVECRREKAKAELEAVTTCLAEVKVEYDRLLSGVRTLRMLLAAFNALTDIGEVKLLKPEKGTPYWYIRSMSTVKSFEVVMCSWNDWKSDHYRYADGNMFIDQHTAVAACQALNAFLVRL